jgi:hypothetical protein
MQVSLFDSVQDGRQVPLLRLPLGGFQNFGDMRRPDSYVLLLADADSKVADLDAENVGLAVKPAIEDPRTAYTYLRSRGSQLVEVLMRGQIVLC